MPSIATLNPFIRERQGRPSRATVLFKSASVGVSVRSHFNECVCLSTVAALTFAKVLSFGNEMLELRQHRALLGRRSFTLVIWSRRLYLVDCL
jgi:hypothetical protein